VGDILNILVSGGLRWFSRLQSWLPGADNGELEKSVYPKGND
jgi:hypothetical protein